MSSRIGLLLELLHTCDGAVLATHSAALPGYPFASGLAFAPDAQHRPVFLISRLAEHTQNLLHDPRSSLFLRQAGTGPELARATLIGEARPLVADELLVARYLRYQPAAKDFLAFGDFTFYRLEPSRIRTIGGFAQAGWLEGERLHSVPALSPAEEARWLGHFAADLPAGSELLGIDAHGLDLNWGGTRRRLGFGGAPVAGEALGQAIAAALAKFDAR